MSVLCLVAGGLMRSAADGFGILPAILVAAPLGAVFFLIALLVQGRASRGDVALGPMPVWKMGAPFIPLLLAAYAWDLDLLSWALTLIIMVATVGIGFIVTRPSTVAASAT